MVDEDGSLGKGEREPPSSSYHYLTIPPFIPLSPLYLGSRNDRTAGRIKGMREGHSPFLTMSGEE